MFLLGIIIGLVIGVVFNATLLKWGSRVKNIAQEVAKDAKADIDKTKKSI